MDSTLALQLSYEDLKLYTNEFSEENFIGKLQFGRLYRGKIPQGPDGMEPKEVVVKIWEDTKIYVVYHLSDNDPRLSDELFLLTHPTMVSHPKLMTLIGYCKEGEHLGIVYDFKPLDTVHNLLLKESFTWLQRINVALQFACLLEFLHTPNKMQLPYLVRNIDAAHIMLDEDYNMKLFDFGMISGGIFPDRRGLKGYVCGCYGYIDPYYSAEGEWSEKCDVFAFGILLLELIAKRVFNVEKDIANFDAPFVHEWAQSEYKQKCKMGHDRLKFSLVHQSLEVDSDFFSSDGPKITKLAMQCVKYHPSKRPTMKQVIKHLLSLDVACHHADILGIEQGLRGPDADPQKPNVSGGWRYLSSRRKKIRTDTC